jgi:hypothetical protein
VTVDAPTYFGFDAGFSRNNSPTSPSLNNNSKQTLQAAIKNKYGNDYTVTQDAQGNYIVTKKPVQYVSQKDSRTKKVRTGQEYKYNSYSPHKITISKSGQVLQDEKFATYTEDVSKYGYTKRVYSKEKTDYTTGSQSIYATRNLNKGRESPRLISETKAGQTKEFKIINKDDKNYKPRTQKQKELIRTQGFSVRQTQEYKVAGLNKNQRKAYYKAVADYKDEQRALLYVQQKTQNKINKSTAEKAFKEQFEKNQQLLSNSKNKLSGQKVDSYYISSGSINKIGSSNAVSFDSNAKSSDSSSYETNFLNSFTKGDNAKSFSWKTTVEPNSGLNEFKQTELGKGVNAGAKVVGYAVGEPIRWLGSGIQAAAKPFKTEFQKENIQLFGNNITTNKITPKTQIYFGLKTSGEFLEGVGTGFKEKPIKAVGSLALGAAFKYGTNAASAGSKFTGNALRKVLPNSLVAKTGIIGKYGIGGGLAVSYGADVTRRVKASNEPIKEAGSIYATEIKPFVAGQGFGDSAYKKTVSGYVRLRGKEFIPAEKLVEPQVLSGKKDFPIAKNGKDALAQFNKQTYSISRTDSAPKQVYHSTAGGLFNKQAVTQAGRGATSKADPEGLFVAPSASIYFARLGAELPTTYSVLPAGSGRPSIINIAVKDVKRLPPEVLSGNKYNAIKKQNVFSEQVRGDRTAYVTARMEKGLTSEAEAIIPKDSILSRTSKNYAKYTKVDGNYVPIQEFKLVGSGTPKTRAGAVGTKTFKRYAAESSKYYSSPKSRSVIPVGVSSVTSSKLSSAVSSVTSSSRSSISSKYSSFASSSSSSISSSSSSFSSSSRGSSSSSFSSSSRGSSSSSSSSFGSSSSGSSSGSSSKTSIIQITPTPPPNRPFRFTNSKSKTTPTRTAPKTKRTFTYVPDVKSSLLKIKGTPKNTKQKVGVGIRPIIETKNKRRGLFARK